MQEPHFFNANEMLWAEPPEFPGIKIKALETRATHPAASVILAQVAIGGAIPTHVHEQATETAYVLAGRGILTTDNKKTPLETGAGVTIPPGVAHSLHNTGDIPLELIAVHIPPTR
ncbi:MAG: cupin domain-containing protein [Chloroflexi bacterium]|nr:cupin domain-containing protein [Chloroflexota bacterium]